MEEEVLRVFDGNGKEVGVASREEVHRKGLWHETFHCWFVCREEGKDYVYLQMRSDVKKDYPSLLDITAAGHLMASETVRDGIREVKEELGIDLTFEELIPLGTIAYSVVNGELIDRELANVYLCHNKVDFKDFVLQVEEVSGVVRAEFRQFTELWLGTLNEIAIEGFEMESGTKNFIRKAVTKSSFVPHPLSYYESIIHGIGKNLGGKA